MGQIHSGGFLITATKAISHQLNSSAPLNDAYIYSLLFQIKMRGGRITHQQQSILFFPQIVFSHEFIVS